MIDGIGIVTNTQDEGEIVVTAQLRDDGLSSWFMDLDRARSQNEVLATNRPEGGGSSLGSQPTQPADPGDAGIHASVNIAVPENSPNFAQALAAAKNVAVALAKVESLLNDLPASSDRLGRKSR